MRIDNGQALPLNKKFQRYKKQRARKRGEEI